MEDDQPTQAIDYAAVLADLKKKRDDLDRAIAVIEPLVGASSSALQAGEGVAPVQVQNATIKHNVSEGIGDHTFFGMSASAAAQKYLSIKKKPASAPEMAGALIDGGYPSHSDTFAKTITTTLFRNPETFVKVKRGLWGLKSWYPNYRPKD